MDYERKDIVKTDLERTFLLWIPEIDQRLFKNFKVSRITIEVDSPHPSGKGMHMIYERNEKNA